MYPLERCCQLIGALPRNAKGICGHSPFTPHDMQPSVRAAANSGRESNEKICWLGSALRVALPVTGMDVEGQKAVDWNLRLPPGTNCKGHLRERLPGGHCGSVRRTYNMLSTHVDADFKAPCTVRSGCDLVSPPAHVVLPFNRAVAHLQNDFDCAGVIRRLRSKRPISEASSSILRCNLK